MTTPNINPSDLDRAARTLESKLMEFCTYMEDESELNRFDDIVTPALVKLRAALRPASGMPEAEAVAYIVRNEIAGTLGFAHPEDIDWYKERGYIPIPLYAAPPPVAAPSGEALRYAAQFLIDRLEDFELDETNAKEMCRQYLGFVEPAIDRLKMELASPIASEPKDAGSGAALRHLDILDHYLSLRSLAGVEAASKTIRDLLTAPSGEGQELSMAEENRALVDCCTDAAGNWCSSLTALRALHSRGYRITRAAPSGAKP